MALTFVQYNSVTGDFVNSGVTTVGIHFTNYDFDVGAGGQSAFTAGQSLSGVLLDVWVNGILRRATNDYTVNTSTNVVTLTSAAPQDSWVRIRVYV